MTAATQNLSESGAVKPAGQTAEGGRLNALGSFSNLKVDGCKPIDPDAQRNDHTHASMPSAPEALPEREFGCPLWPGCDCPGGAVRPECPSFSECSQ